MTNEQIQQVVDAENERLNKIAEAKALARLRDIHETDKAIARLQKQRADLVAEVLAIEFDSVQISELVNAAAAPVTE